MRAFYIRASLSKGVLNNAPVYEGVVYKDVLHNIRAEHPKNLSHAPPSLGSHAPPPLRAAGPKEGPDGAAGDVAWLRAALEKEQAEKLWLARRLEDRERVRQPGPRRRKIRAL